MNKPVIDPLKLMAAVADELSRQNPHMVTHPDMMNAVINGCNQIKDAVEQIPCIQEPRP